ncbi:hypothetical protein FQN54_003450 [Arachnomyces sp. PD_36]|nr:hypothetical protein FQN54_003450 [Arachnomyces sp. PD_36]
MPNTTGNEALDPQTSKENAFCTACHDLNPDLYEIKHGVLASNERCIDASFAEIKASAESGACERCGVLYVGITEVHQAWQDDHGKGPDDSWHLGDSTQVIIHVREGHSLRVLLSNGEEESAGTPGAGVTFEFYTRSEAESGSMPQFGIARDVPPQLDLEHCLSLASSWLKNCEAQHPACASTSTTGDRPARLLDLGTARNPDRICLRELQGSDYDKIRYMTLSHCWGKKVILTTKTATLNERKAGIPVSQLSKTFQDAVKITTGLGIRYLWIDSLCIIQDDTDDWEHESKKMASIYAGSQLNIAATKSVDGDGGCFAERWTLDPSNRIDLPTESWEDVIPDDDYEGEPYFISVRPALHVAHDHFTRAADYVSSLPAFSPLLSRGWVFQERLLAPRTLHFHYEELIWECNTGISCECSRLTDYKLGDPDATMEDSTSDQLKTMYWAILGNSTEAEILDSWLDIISDYCSLGLTKEQDRLPALAGLSSRVAPRLRGSSYLAGLWSQDLPRALCWRKDSISVPSYRPPNLEIPSWSWASVWLDKDALITVPHIDYDPVRSKELGFAVDSRFLILDVKNTPKGKGNSFSNATCLTVQGALVPIIYVKENGGGTHFKFGDQVERIRADCLDAHRVTTDVEEGDSFCGLLIGRSLRPYENVKSIISYSLILRKSRDRNQPDLYTRIGLLDSREQENWWKDVSVAKIGVE